MWKGLSILSLAALALLVGNVAVEAQAGGSQAFFSFGGSVKWQKSDVSIKQFVSKMQVHIFSLPDGKLRQVVQVLPNGAYSAVMSEKGQYRIRLSAPQGWNFLPADGYVINLDDDNRSNQMNYVFDLVGFDVSGQVITTGMTTGPRGLVVSALSGNTVVSQTKTTEGGSFTLSSVSPGTYSVVVSDSSSDSEARASTTITVSTNSLKIPQPLVLEGHSLRSKVTFNSKRIANIPVVLLASKSSTITKENLVKFGCSRPSKPIDKLLPEAIRDKVNADLACQVVSGANGDFVFSRLAGGEYYLVAYHDPSLMPPSGDVKSKHLSIAPTHISVTMEHVDRTLEQGFEVTSFRLDGGTVKHASGTPIAGAQVYLDGRLVAKTDATGGYQLDLSAAGEYELQVKSAKMEFDAVKVPLSLATESLPSFTPNRVEVCGQFLLAESLKSGARLPRVEVGTSSSVEATLSSDKKSARFCLHLSPGKHTLRLAKSPNCVRFAPASISIDLSAGPVPDVAFSQFQAELVGEVLLMEAYPINQLSVRLSSNEQLDETAVVSQVELDKSNSKRATFSFKAISPGTYDLELVHGDGSQPASGWCWAKPGLKHRITVVDRDLRNTPELVFKQTGYRVHVSAPLLELGFSKPISLKVTPTEVVNATKVSGKALFFQLNKPLSTICLPSGSFEFEASTACLRLQSPSPSNIDTSEISISLPAKSVTISLREVPVSAEVSSAGAFPSDYSLPELTIQAQVGERVQRTTTSWKKVGEVFTARMNLWAAPGSEVVFSVTPSKPPSEKDKVHPLLVPVTQTLRVPSFGDGNSLSSTSSSYEAKDLEATASEPKIDESDCTAVLAATFGSSSSVAFSMKPGFFFVGKVTPPVDEALVSVYADTGLVSSPPLEVTPKMAALFSEQQLNSPSPNPAHSLVVRALTDSKGSFRIGPFFFDQTTTPTAKSVLTLAVQKPGYEFTQSPGGDWLAFQSQKLALVEIRVVAEAEGDKRPLPDTLVSMIGSEFRDSKKSDSRGFVRYIGLPPGEYYIQPMLKEYEFKVRRGGRGALEAPSEYALAVMEGESMSVELVGRRVAFSAFGEVTSLSGVPEEGVLVEARLLSPEELEGYKGQPVLPTHGATKETACHGDSGPIVPVEQAISDDFGHFRLMGLLPGCTYLVTASRSDKTNGRRGKQAVFPSHLLVKPHSEDVHGLHFYLKPRAYFGMISATVDADAKVLPDLTIVVSPAHRPDTEVIRYNFGTAKSRFFALLGDQIEPLVGGHYVMRLEASEGVAGSSGGHGNTVQSFPFSVDEDALNRHQHFNFAFPSTRV